MAVNSISLNSVQASNVSTVHLPYVGGSNRIDILHQLGTSLGTAAFSNPSGSDIAITLDAGTINTGTLPLLTDRTAGSGALTFTAAPTIKIEFLNNFEIDVSTYQLRTSTNSDYWEDFRVEVSNDDVTWTEIDRQASVAAPPGTNDFFEYHCSNRYGFYKYIRFRCLTMIGDGALTDLFIYGKLRNLTTGVAGTRASIGTMKDFPDIDAARSNLDNRIFIYDGTTWELQPNTPWKVLKRVLSDSLYIDSGYEPTFYVVSPNGAARDIFLPDAQIRDTIRIKNLDGAFDLSVHEFDVTILNNSLSSYFQFSSTTDEKGAVSLVNTGVSFLGSGIQGNYANLEDSGDKLEDTSYTPPAGSFTIGIWVYLRFDLVSTYTFISNYRDDTNLRGFRLTYRGGLGNEFEWRVSTDGTNTDAVTGFTPALDTWYHLTATYDSVAGEIELFVDGVSQGTASTATGGIFDPSQPLIFGQFLNAGGSASWQFLGRLDECGIWDRVLSQAEIDLLYNSGSGQSYASISAPTTPVVLNNAGKLQYEFVYDGTEWLVTG